MDYFKFYSQNTGRMWRHRINTNIERDKLSMWLEYKNSPDILQELTENKNKHWERFDKKDYKNGFFVGQEIDQATLSRVNRRLNDGK
jgi:hypothetical protein